MVEWGSGDGALDDMDVSHDLAPKELFPDSQLVPVDDVMPMPIMDQAAPMDVEGAPLADGELPPVNDHMGWEMLLPEGCSRCRNRPGCTHSCRLKHIHRARQAASRRSR